MRFVYLCIVIATVALGVGSVRAQVAEPASLTPEEINELYENLPPNEYIRARVDMVLDEAVSADPYLPTADQFVQHVAVTFLDGDEEGASMEVVYYPGTADAEAKLKSGDTVLVMKTYGIDRSSYVVLDRYRLDNIVWLVGAFVVIAVLLAGSVGFRSLLGLAFSVMVILWYMIPSIIAGRNPLVVSLLGSAAIAGVAIYLAHGFKPRTTIALVSTVVTISISIGLAMLAVTWAHLFGLGTEEALYVQLGDTAAINLRGLLLGGIIVGLLGVLDDITTAQSAVVDELKKANPTLSFRELFVRAYSVGKEHIASLINTLALAYVGVSLPLLILFNQYERPLRVILNSEIIAEEIVRTLVGSTALILAVPITTAIASYFFSRRRTPEGRS